MQHNANAKSNGLTNFNGHDFGVFHHLYRTYVCLNCKEIYNRSGDSFVLHGTNRFPSCEEIIMSKAMK